MLRFARVVSAVFATLNIGAAVLLVVGVVVGAPGLGLLAALVCVGVPAVALYGAIRQGHVADRFVSERRLRLPFAVLMAVLLGTTAAVFTVVGAPGVLVAALLAELTACGFAGLISVWWKISAHVTIAGLLAGVSVVLWGWPGVAVVAVPLVVAWARVRLGAHTQSQAVAGGALGVVSALWLTVPL